MLVQLNLLAAFYDQINVILFACRQNCKNKESASEEGGLCDIFYLTFMFYFRCLTHQWTLQCVSVSLSGRHNKLISFQLSCPIAAHYSRLTAGHATAPADNRT